MIELIHSTSPGTGFWPKLFDAWRKSTTEGLPASTAPDGATRARASISAAIARQTRRSLVVAVSVSVMFCSLVRSDTQPMSRLPPCIDACALFDRPPPGSNRPRPPDRLRRRAPPDSPGGGSFGPVGQANPPLTQPPPL